LVLKLRDRKIIRLFTAKDTRQSEERQMKNPTDLCWCSCLSLLANVWRAEKCLSFQTITLPFSANASIFVDIGNTSRADLLAV